MHSDTPVLSVLVTASPPPSDMNIPLRSNRPTHTNILLTLIRLEPQLTDMLITLNIPHIPGSPEAVAVGGEDLDFETAKYGSAVEEGRKVVEAAISSLTVKDWGLFGPRG